MDGLLQKLAEQVYRTTQPYRYAIWLQIQSRNEESVAVLKPLAASGPPGERGWAYVGLGGNAIQRQSERAGLALYQRGLAFDPNNFLLAVDIATAETALGREEDASRYVQMAQTLLTAHGANYTVPDRIASVEHNYRSIVLRHQGALLQSYQERLAAAAVLVAAGLANQGFIARAETLALLHQTTAARANFAEAPPLSINVLPTSVPSMTIAMAEQDWPSVLAAEKDFADIMKMFPGLAEAKPAIVDPAIAVALAHMENFAAAESRLKDMPGDCYPCLRARAQVAALQGQDARADWWFARAAAAAPTAPYAETEWGRALLDRKQPDAAIAHFTAANRIGPHFADPIEGWGEALMSKNQSHLALAKFSEAEKYAPNWGRLHLRWGEALVYAGKRDEAKAQFTRAAQLDLTPSEKVELARHP
jgi:tetratricopeptide (TPR) repeat protein